MLATVLLRCLTLALFVSAAASPVIAQTQYSIGNPTNDQQYMLELINRARADGGAEAARLGLSGLQEGPPSIGGEPFTIANSAQPLSWNSMLFTAAQNHANNLNNNDQFFLGGSPHTFGGTTPEQRINAAGYPMNLGQEYNGPTTASGFFPGPENVATNVSIGSGPYVGAKLTATILSQHNGLFTDQTVPGRGHRMTTMLTYWREIGIGVSAGTDNGQNNTWESLYTVQNFGRQTNSTPFITGVVYNDANGNGFYDPGEGVGGVRVDVAGSNFFAISTASGGYSVPVPGNGSYNVTFSGSGQTTTQRTVTVANSLNAKSDFLAGAAPNPTALANVSTRLPVGTGDSALIAGIILTGTQDKKVIVRAIAPSLGIPGQLANPTLQLFSGQTSLGFNDDWMNSSPADRQAILDSGIPPSNNLEAAIVRTLPANSAGYTAVVRGANNTTGIAVVEVYDLDRSVDSKLANISTRGFVQTGDNALFAGTIVVGAAPQRVIVRAIGPSLNLVGKMLDPILELRNANGAVIRANDNWKIGGQETEIMQSGVAPANDLESAIIETLPANGATYTAILRGAGNTTGIAVVEVYTLN
ncbi:MAG TPA: CAP domain-containing protein [Chthoniobacterales bacterium]|nr:CAP domain-containing protein [Chthoniobacterales bacterium]